MCGLGSIEIGARPHKYAFIGPHIFQPLPSRNRSSSPTSTNHRQDLFLALPDSALHVALDVLIEPLVRGQVCLFVQPITYQTLSHPAFISALISALICVQEGVYCLMPRSATWLAFL